MVQTRHLYLDYPNAQRPLLPLPPTLQRHLNIPELNLVSPLAQDGWTPYPNPLVSSTMGWKIPNPKQDVPKVSKVVPSNTKFLSYSMLLNMLKHASLSL